MPKRPASSSSATPSSQKKKPDPAKPAPPSASADGCVWRPARRTLELTVRPMEPLPFVGSVELRVVSGAVVVLGHELRASDPPRGVELHSPAGGCRSRSRRRRRCRAARASSCARRAGAPTRPRRASAAAGAAARARVARGTTATTDADAERDDDGGGSGDGGGAGEGDATRLGVRALPTLRPSARLGAVVPAAWEAAADELCSDLRAAGGARRRRWCCCADRATSASRPSLGCCATAR